MGIINLLKEDRSTANDLISETLKQKAFSFLDNYILTEAVVPGSVKKDSKGNIKSFKTVGDKNHEKDMKSRKEWAKDFGGDIRHKVKELTKEDLDNMDQEEFDSLVENFDQLDELSKATLGSYIKSAALDTTVKSHTAGQDASSGNFEKSDGQNKKSVKRLGNIDKAADKLAK